MPIAVSVYTQFRGFAVAPEDVQEGEVEAIEILLNRNGQISKASVRRKSLSITIRGLAENEVGAFVQEADANNLRLIRGSAVVESIALGEFRLTDALLMKATPSMTIEVAGMRLVESLQLEYHSLRYV